MYIVYVQYKSTYIGDTNIHCLIGDKAFGTLLTLHIHILFYSHSILSYFLTCCLFYSHVCCYVVLFMLYSILLGAVVLCYLRLHCIPLDAALLKYLLLYCILC